MAPVIVASCSSGTLFHPQRQGLRRAKRDGHREAGRRFPPLFPGWRGPVGLEGDGRETLRPAWRGSGLPRSSHPWGRRLSWPRPQPHWSCSRLPSCSRCGRRCVSGAERSGAGQVRAPPSSATPAEGLGPQEAGGHLCGENEEVRGK